MVGVESRLLGRIYALEGPLGSVDLANEAPLQLLSYGDKDFQFTEQTYSSAYDTINL